MLMGAFPSVADLPKPVKAAGNGKRFRPCHVAPADSKYSKKRCMHFAESGVSQDNERTAPVEESVEVEATIGTNLPTSSTNAGSANESLHSNEDQTEPSTSNVRRFISDFQPESTFLQRQPASDKASTRPQDEVGIWVDRRDYDSLVRQKTIAGDAGLDSKAGGQRPNSAVVGPLIDVFFRKVHPVLPLLNEAEFRSSHARGVVPEVLAHAICLVAAKHAEAAPHLRLNEATTALSPREFCSRLHGSVIAALRVPVRLEKITLIRTLALTSLHAEGTEGSEGARFRFPHLCHHLRTAC